MPAMNSPAVQRGFDRPASCATPFVPGLLLQSRALAEVAVDIVATLFARAVMTRRGGGCGRTGWSCR